MSRDQRRSDRAFLASHWRPYLGDVPAILLLTLVNACLLVTAPLVMKHAVDAATGPGAADGRTPLLGGALLACLAVGQFLVYATLITLRARMNLRFDFGVRTRAFEHALGAPSEALQAFRIGDLVTRLTDDVTEKLAWFMCSGIFRLVEALTIIAFGATMMVRLDPMLALSACGSLPLLIGLHAFVAGRLEARYDEVQRTISEQSARLETCFSGIRVVKAFAAEGVQRRVVAEAVESQRRAEVRAMRLQSLMDFLYGHVWQLAVVGVLLVGGTLAVRGEVSLGDLIAFDAYVLLLVFPMFDVAQFLVKRRIGRVSMARIREVEALVPEEGERPRARRAEDAVWVETAAPELPEPVSLAFERVTYAHPGARRPAVRDAALSVEPGELVAVCGPVGAGKSTLLGLAAGVMEPTGGSVRLGDRARSDWPHGVLGRAVAWVPQEPYLLSGTIDENVRMGRAFIEDADVALALRIAGLEHDLTRFPEGLATRVGARGVRLSGGQKQRVCLARALAGRPRVLLLDDVTASLDAATEDAVWRAIARELPETAALAVTHRVSTLERAARVVLLEAGRVVDQGPLRELLIRSPEVRRLYARWGSEVASGG